VTHDAADYFSRLAGTATVHATNRGSTWPLLLPWADRGRRGVGEAARPLITPDELTTMGHGAGGWRGAPAAPGPADPDPLAHFQERRLRALLPMPNLVVPPPAPGFAEGLDDPLGAGLWADTGAGQGTPGCEEAGLPAIGGADLPLAPVAAAQHAGSGGSSAPDASDRRRVDGSVPALVFPPALTPGERRVLAALAATGWPDAEVSSAELAGRRVSRRPPCAMC
jgi:hypothetical protein